MPYIKGKYFTESEIEEGMRSLTSEERDEVRRHIKPSYSDPLLSAAVGFAMGSSILGAVVGGSLLGGLLGDFAEGSDDSIL